MLIQCDGKTPHFSFEELAELWNATAAKRTPALRETARRLYPGREESVYENLSVTAGPGRAFRREDGTYEKPQCNLVSWPTTAGVLKDGTILPF